MIATQSVIGTPVARLAGVGQAVANQLERLGIVTIGDLVRHYPYRYEDLREITPVSSLSIPVGGPPNGGPGAIPVVGPPNGGLGAIPVVGPPNGGPGTGIRRSRHSGSLVEEVNIIGVIRQFKHIRLRGRVRSKSTAIVEDDTGQLGAVWFGRWYLGNQLKPGMRIFLRGRVERTLAGAQLLVSRHRVLAADEPYRGELQPVYPQTASLPSAKIGGLIRKVLPRVLADRTGLANLDPLPPSINRKRRFADAAWALRAIHAPDTMEDAEKARRRLVYEEFFLLAAAGAIRRAARKAETAPDLSRLADREALESLLRDFRGMLPFSLTKAQERVIGEIAEDMTRPAPMNRLLQGDVGCGKTAVAAAAVLVAAKAGAQAAFMAPTEVLAVQQFNKLQPLLAQAGLKTALLIGNLRKSTRDAIVAELRAGDLDAVVGTHALITEDVTFSNLGLVVIDEQHRFGVMQRAALRAKARGHTPHTLVMTATPIPRTLAQTIYADLDVSIIDELPPGRRPVKTYVRTADKKPEIFDFVREKVVQGRQAYIVCPAIDETERAIHTAKKQAEELRATVFKDLRVGMLHGRMSVSEKDRTMRLFADGFVGVLIATTVVEVGVDVPNAAIMVVLDAERFGLSQLHQLRGRVGRGAATSYCILVASGDAEEVHRLRVLESTNDGFVVAEEDMKQRGSGDIAGTRQHGDAELRLAHLIRDYPVFVEAKKDAEALVNADPQLTRPEHAALATFLAAQAPMTALRATS